MKGKHLMFKIMFKIVIHSIQLIYIIDKNDQNSIPLERQLQFNNIFIDFITTLHRVKSSCCCEKY